MTATLRHWELRCVELGRPVTMNAHRTMHPHKRADVDRTWRSTFAWLAKEQRIPHLNRIRVVVLPLHADHRSPQDVAACAPAAKAAVDGIVDAGVIVDDDHAHLVAVTFLPPLVDGSDGLVIRVLEAV